MIKKVSSILFSGLLDLCIRKTHSMLKMNMIPRMLCLQNYIDKNNGRFPLFHFSSSIYFYRQKGMHRQLDKITDLIRLIIQKLEIPAEIEVDDSSKINANENLKKIQKIRQGFSFTRR